MGGVERDDGGDGILVFYGGRALVSQKIRTFFHGAKGFQNGDKHFKSLHSLTIRKDLR